MSRVLLYFSTLFVAVMTASASHAISWQTSCEVDSGSIKQSFNSYVFHKSKNHCPGGIYHQRSEIYTENISISRKSAYVFDTTISMKTASREEFIVFQIHDGRRGCSPPMSLRWTSGNTFRFDSDYTRGKGMAGCVSNRSLRSAQYSGPSLRRDGTPYHLQVKLTFDGDGGFGIDVLVNGASKLSGTYRPSDDPSFVSSKKFYMKHGVYSQNLFDYEMKSEGMRVSQEH